MASGNIGLAFGLWVLVVSIASMLLGSLVEGLIAFLYLGIVLFALWIGAIVIFLARGDVQDSFY